MPVFSSYRNHIFDFAHLLSFLISRRLLSFPGRNESFSLSLWVFSVHNFLKFVLLKIRHHHSSYLRQVSFFWFSLFNWWFKGDNFWLHHHLNASITCKHVNWYTFVFSNWIFNQSIDILIRQWQFINARSAEEGGFKKYHQQRRIRALDFGFIVLYLPKWKEQIWFFLVFKNDWVFKKKFYFKPKQTNAIFIPLLNVDIF